MKGKHFTEKVSVWKPRRALALAGTEFLPYSGHHVLFVSCVGALLQGFHYLS